MSKDKLLTSLFEGIEETKKGNRSRLGSRLSDEDARMLYDIIELTPNPMYYKNEEGVYIYCNATFSDYLGIKKEKIIGYTAYDISPLELAEVYNKQDRELIENKNNCTYKSKVKYTDGTLHDVLINKVVNFDENNNVKGIVGSMTDITELVSYQNRLDRLLKLKQAMLEMNKIIIEKNDLKEIFNAVLEKVSIAMDKADIGCVLVLDKEQNLKIIASKGYDVEQCKKFSIKLQESFHYLKTHGRIDKPIIINNIQNYDWNRYTDYWRWSQNKENKAVLIDNSEHVDWKNYEKVLENAQEIKLKTSISTPILFDGQLFGFIDIDSTQENAFDKSDLEVMEYIKNQIEVGVSKYKLYEQMIYLSRYDKLTNIYNRGYFEKLFNNSINEAVKKSGEFYLVILDLNGLKTVNDTYGHLGGDEMIKNFSSHLKLLVSDNGYLGRLGGDEFAAVIDNANIKELNESLELINNDLKNNKIIFEGNKISGSFSYGIAQFPYDGINYNALFKKADKNMYDYKQKVKMSNDISEGKSSILYKWR